MKKLLTFVVILSMVTVISCKRVDPSEGVMSKDEKELFSADSLKFYTKIIKMDSLIDILENVDLGKDSVLIKSSIKSLDEQTKFLRDKWNGKLK